MNDLKYHQEKRLAAWSKKLAQPVFVALDNDYQKILSGEFVARINPEAYRLPKTACGLLICSDERLNNLNLEEMFYDQREGKPIFSVRLPGAVVGQDIEKLKGKLEEYNFSKLAAAAHADCGAVAADLQQKGLKISIDQHAKDLVSNLEGIEDWGFIDKIKDPELNLIHPGSCLLVDGTGRHNFLSDGVLPNEYFVLNRAVYDMYDNDELVKLHISILVSVALGAHGIGIKIDGDKEHKLGFSKLHPFYIFVSALDDLNLRRYMDEADIVAKTFPENLVKTIGFLAPKVD